MLRATLGSILFLLLAPGLVVGLVPWLLLDGRTDLWPALASPRWAGLAALLIGLAPLLDSFARFVTQGRGTPAPVAPPTRLVVTGFYRHVRNPMYVGVMLALVGEALLFADPRVAAWAAFVLVAFSLFVRIYEEPTLAKTFGAEYARYCAAVPRWIPRLSPWEAQGR
jgi:protein-S-isoprenylcysteine O-methyltransferase Ste14